MARVKRGSKRRARRKKISETRKRILSSQIKSSYPVGAGRREPRERFSFRDRRVRKRQFRTLWIQRIGGGRAYAGMSYSQLMHGSSRRH